MATTPAKATLTCAEILRAPTRWTKLQNPINQRKIGPWELTTIGCETLKVNDHVKAGVLLDGLTYQNKWYAHITITPDSDGTWSYFHLTIVGSAGGSIYFKLIQDEEGTLKVKRSNHTVIAYEKKSVIKSESFLSSEDATQDLAAVMRGLVNKDFI